MTRDAIPADFDALFDVINDAAIAYKA